MPLHDEPDYKRLFIAVLLAAVLLMGWQMKVEWPRRQALAHYAAEQTRQHAVEQQQYAQSSPAQEAGTEDNPALTEAQRLALSPRIAIRSATLDGSIALKGARFDDLHLAKYRETLAPDSPEVTLFFPNGNPEAYFAQAGWIASDGTRIPDQNSLWRADKMTLNPGGAVHLTWDNGEGVTFFLTVSLDNHYMFDIRQRVENHSGHAISVTPYAYINRVHDEAKQASAIMHEGPIGVLEGTLDEVSYKDLREKGNKVYDQASGWLGITDKYWLSALIPDSQVKATFSHYSAGGHDRYQADLLDRAQSIAPGGSADYHVRLFAGAKEVHLLDRYAAGDAAHLPIPLFDRAVDFGSLYFLSKPMFLVLSFFFAHTGNFGVAILLLTIVVRLMLFPLANKSFKAAAQMRRLQPEVAKIKERYFDDQITLNKEMMALYKREKVNPAAGCLPVLIQMPVFFALYKVLYVTIEMRHAPFFGWVRDLSATDPSNLFTLFGLIPWSPPAFLHLGLLPILYCITMFIQMRQQPKPADPVQAKMMNYMPLFLLLVFAKMPAGLVVYWTWSNILSIIQQQVITRRHGAPKIKGQRPNGK